MKSPTKQINKCSYFLAQLFLYQVANLEKLGYTTLTVVQDRGIPTILEGEDALVKSQTGSGKTLCYAVPIVEKLMKVSSFFGGENISRCHRSFVAFT